MSTMDADDTGYMKLCLPLAKTGDRQTFCFWSKRQPAFSTFFFNFLDNWNLSHSFVLTKNTVSTNDTCSMPLSYSKTH